jgi:hypothetical protein
MVNKRRIESFVKDNSLDIGKVEFSLNEIKVDIDTRILKKMNRQNNR